MKRYIFLTMFTVLLMLLSLSSNSRAATDVKDTHGKKAKLSAANSHRSKNKSVGYTKTKSRISSSKPCPAGMKRCNGRCIPKNDSCYRCGPGQKPCKGGCIGKGEPCTTCGKGKKGCNGACVSPRKVCILCGSGQKPCKGGCIGKNEPCTSKKRH
jgi:hypothetical protein